MKTAHHLGGLRIAEIVKKHKEGSSITALAKEYQIDRTTVQWHVRKAGTIPKAPTQVKVESIQPLPLPPPSFVPKPAPKEWEPRLPGVRLPDNPRMLCNQCCSNPATQVEAAMADGSKRNIQMICISCMKENHKRLDNR